MYIVPVWMVARATSAAPKYFTSFHNYVDGGVKANNPCEFAMSEITEIRRCYESQSLTLPSFFGNGFCGNRSFSHSKT